MADSTVFFLSFVDYTSTLYSNYESYTYSQQRIKKSNSTTQQCLVGQVFAAFPLGSVICCLSLLGLHNKISQIGWLKNLHKFNFSSSGGLEAQDQGASRIDVRGELSPWVADGHILAVLIWSFLGAACLPVHRRWGDGERESEVSGVSSYKALILLDLSPTLMTSFNLNYFFRDTIFKYSHTGV